MRVKVVTERQRLPIQADLMERWYDRDGALAYSVALAMLGDGARAENVVWECFRDLWHGIVAGGSGDLPRQSALLRTVVNRCS